MLTGPYEGPVKESRRVRGRGVGAEGTVRSRDV
jgi:hypothetical protein